MRIAIWHHLPSGGQKRALHTYVHGLVKRGHDVESWSPPTADLGFLPLAPDATEHVVALDTAATRLNAFTRPFHAVIGFEDRLQAMLTHCRLCADAIHGGGFDIAFVHPCRWFNMSHMGRFLDIPTCLCLAEPCRRLYEAQPDQPWAALDLPATFTRSPRQLRRWFGDTLRVDALRRQVREEKASALTYGRILVNSLFSRESVARAYGLDSTFAHLNIDTNHFVPGTEPRGQFVMGLGSFTRQKGIDTAIAAVAAMPAPRPPLVWIANHVDDAYRAEMEQLAQTMQVTLDTRTMQPDAEVIRLLQTAAVFLYTSRLEPFGLAPLEANACGTPVVAVAEGGVRETIVDGVNGYLVPNRDPAALATQMRRFTDDPAHADAMGARAREHIVSQWSVGQSLDILETHLSELAAAATAH